MRKQFLKGNKLINTASARLIEGSSSFCSSILDGGFEILKAVFVNISIFLNVTPNSHVK
jgi:hypothetical protein